MSGSGAIADAVSGRRTQPTIAASSGARSDGIGASDTAAFGTFAEPGENPDARSGRRAKLGHPVRLVGNAIHLIWLFVVVFALGDRKSVV